MVTTNDQGPFSGAHEPQTSVAPQTEATHDGGPGTPAVTETQHDGHRFGGGARRVLIPVIVGLVAALIAAGITVAITRPGAEDARDQRDRAQAELVSAHADLADANGRATAASAAARGCQQLSDDSAEVVEELARMDELLQAWADVPIGSPDDVEISKQLDDNYLVLIRLRGALVSDQAICGGTPVGT